MEDLQPILTPGDVLNGIVFIKIVNLDKFFENGQCGMNFQLSYKFNLQFANIYYPKNIWKSTEWLNLFVDPEDKQFCLKVPLFLLPYSIEFKLLIQRSILNDSNKWQPVACDTSSSYTLTIPSILIESTVQKGDHIQYNVPNSGISRYGYVLEIEQNDMIKVKLDESNHNESQLLQHEQKIMSLPANTVFRFPAEFGLLIDLTNRDHAIYSLILRTTNNDKISIFIELANYLLNLFWNDIKIQEIEECDQDFFYMSGFVAVNIHQFLFSAEYNYRVDCPLDGGCLYFDNCWTDFVQSNFSYPKLASFKVEEIEDQLERCGVTGVGYTCDICRTEISWYAFVFGCDNGDQAFCLSCIHSMVMQYDEMKPFLCDLLVDVLDGNCIEEIVSFVVGKIYRFDVKDNMEVDNVQVNSDSCDYDVIDDNVTVGSKRGISEIQSSNPVKRQKLQ